MNTALRTILAIATLAAGLLQSQPATAEIADLVLVNATAEQEARTPAALDTYAAAGLTLPPLEIEFSDNTDLCGGNAGMYRPRSFQDPTLADKLDICDRLPTILLHELAHAWERHNATDQARADLLARWDLERWNDDDDAWHDRGTERAAETVTYALFLDAPTEIDAFLKYVCGFEQLTGIDAPTAVAGSDCTDNA